MQITKILTLISFLFVILTFEPKIFAQKINDATYNYPYKDPFLATSTVALMQGRETVPFVDIRDLEINVLEGRDNIHFLEGMGKLHYRFYQQKSAAPLIYIIPGVGSSAYSGSVRFLAEYLARQGFHVLVLPSPFDWHFTLAASRSGFPGLIQEDASDLYNAMNLTLDSVKTLWQAKIGNIGLLGLSEGARDAGFISKLDAVQKKIGIDTYLLINPPVDLLKAVRQIDTMASLGNSYGAGQKSDLEAYAVGKVEDALENDPDNPDYFMNWDKRTQLTDNQLEYLIGNELQKTVGDVIYASALAFGSGVLKTPISWGYRNARLDEAHSFTFMGYIKAFLLPRLRPSDNKRISIEQLNTQTSLKSLKTALEHNKKMFLMHNLDDFLVSDQDLAFLKKTFGERSKFYPHGGHLGNLWYEENKKDIAGVFKSLLQYSTKHIEM